MTDSQVEPPRSFNFADIWEMAAAAVPDREALVVGEQRRTYGQLEERANRLAGHLAGRGLAPGDHVALYMENCAEYVEGMLAAFKLRAVPINVNHRYVAGELSALLDGSDSVAVLTQPSLLVTVESVLAREGHTSVRFVLSTGDDYDAAIEAGPADPPRVARSGDDRYVIYTGGTTGLPKGVEWRQEDAFFACIGGGDPLRLEGPVSQPSELVERLVDQQVCYMTLAPMMHAAAQWTAFSWLFCGGKVVLMPGSFDPRAVWETVEREAVQVMTGVGDAMFRPLLDAWDEVSQEGLAPDIGSLFVLSNGGAPLAAVTKQRVFKTFPDVMVNDGFGSSEAGVQGASRLNAADAAASASVVSFDHPSKPTVVVDPLGNEVEPGSEVVGQVLAGGRLPLGYYNDPDKTAEAFVERDGERWLVTGDLATVEPDGAISLVGRGSGVINTGGEKVYPEEVEGVLKGHEAVYDCLVVGVPDDHWGDAVAVVVQPVAPVTLEELVRHSKRELAGYKAPKHLVVVEEIRRSPSGKADYRWARATATGYLTQEGS
jgi:acyl-CoA synthetase (AMP-forming)/AMP-acid ligase II